MLFLQLFLTFAKIGMFTFGSGYAMLALAETELVRVHRWLTAEQFGDAVALAEVTPGPIMVNLATFVGTKTNGFLGAIMATLGLVLPPMLLLYLLAVFYINFKDQPWVIKVFQGLRPAIVGLIFVVVIRLGQANLVGVKSILIALAVVFAILIGVHPILTVVTAGVLGLFIF